MEGVELMVCIHILHATQLLYIYDHCNSNDVRVLGAIKENGVSWQYYPNDDEVEQELMMGLLKLETLQLEEVQ